MSKRTVELELATPGLDARGQPVRVPLGVAAAPGTSDVAPPEPDLPGEHMLINLGPQHPATHGVLRLVVELDGETVVRVIPHLGDRKSTRLNSSHRCISYAVFCLKKKK